jgi:hypothetical protein
MTSTQSVAPSVLVRQVAKLKQNLESVTADELFAYLHKQKKLAPAIELTTRQFKSARFFESGTINYRARTADILQMAADLEQTAGLGSRSGRTRDLFTPSSSTAQQIRDLLPLNKIYFTRAVYQYVGLYTILELATSYNRTPTGHKFTFLPVPIYVNSYPFHNLTTWFSGDDVLFYLENLERSPTTPPRYIAEPDAREWIGHAVPSRIFVDPGVQP